MHVLFHSGDDPYSRAIQIWTWSRATHCELEFSDGLRFTALPGVGCTFRSPLVPGTPRWRRSRQLVGDEAAVRSFCKSVHGARYDWAGIFLSQLLPMHRDSHSRFFCSEVCFRALCLGGYLGVGPWEDPAEISPREALAAIGETWDSLSQV